MAESVIKDNAHIIEYYSREDIINELLKQSKNKEVGICFNMKYYGQRPDVLSNAQDIITLAKAGATSFHISQETWSDPFLLQTNNSKKEMDQIRTGWDLIFDIDTDDIEYSKICAHFIIKKLNEFGISSTAKFSGGNGVHIGVVYESFPKIFNGQKMNFLFPEVPRIIINFIREDMRAEFTNYFLKNYDIEKIVNNIKENLFNDLKDFSKVENKLKLNYYKNGFFDPFSIIKVDTVLVASRHLYRMLYSVNEKTGLVSIPIDINNILNFDKNMAKIENIELNNILFLNRNVKEGCAINLLVQSYDFQIKNMIAEEEKRKTLINRQRNIPKIPEEYFSPCMKCILKGMSDGKKRSLFIMQNYLSNIGWTKEDTELLFNDWNDKHDEPLRPTYIKTHLNYHDKQKDKKLPPNCDNKTYYVDMGICKPDNLCQKIKNPVSYTIRKANTFIEEFEKKSKKNKTQK
ncbi:hypothetical protein HOK68_05060 [Candidatus Woesearchaeota archaeon]|mgnify:FL=1|jgi:DNA primase catalytic subunit|nr:hypothetical protein [Candidatus Woesearchaeota archaeon]MBT4595576.1 hypothetical protein [Candidatus Woesearchaeota archaeon]MBT5740941.1 hypothetical protein [Candidatus Woesearchaeota archaeon]MBT6506118.1 hypothetical protein [Candidatus Woesearchaeota archaeon]MBT7296493.1 hypothetical protein [Candidatus Woesearchaeota archaeon]